MNTPSIKTIMQTGTDRPTARKIKAVFTMNRAALYVYETARTRTRGCYNPPGITDLRLTVINGLLETFGVEGIETDHFGWLEYCNAGNTYTTTICHFDGHFVVSSWGDLIERRHIKTKEAH